MPPPPSKSPPSKEAAPFGKGGQRSPRQNRSGGGTPLHIEMTGVKGPPKGQQNNPSTPPDKDATKTELAAKKQEELRRKSMLEEKEKAMKAALKVEKQMKEMEEHEEAAAAAAKSGRPNGKRRMGKKPPHAAPKRRGGGIPVLDLKKHLNGHGMLTKFDGAIRRRNLAIFALTILVIIVNVCQLELGYRSWTDSENAKDIVSNVLKCLVWILSFAQVGLVWDYYKLQSKLETVRFALDVKSVSWGKWVFVWPGNVLRAWLESAVYFLYPVPFLELANVPDRFCPIDDCETNENFSSEETYIIPWVDDKFAICVFLRLYIVLRVMRDYSRIYRTRTTIVEKMSMAKMKNLLSGKDFDWLLTIKYFLSAHPVHFVPMISFMAIVLFAYCIHVCERTISDGYHDAEFGFGDSIWFIFITMSTIGYGDRFPVTTEGRLVTMIAGCCGMVITALLTMVTLDKLVLSQPERSHVTALERHAIQKMQRDVCARYIQIRWRERMYHRKCKSNAISESAAKTRSFHTKLGKLLKAMRQLRLSMRELELSSESMDDVLTRLEMIEKMLDPDGRKRASIQLKS